MGGHSVTAVAVSFEQEAFPNVWVTNTTDPTPDSPQASDDEWHVVSPYKIFEDDGDPAWVNHSASLDAEEETWAKDELQRQKKARWIASLVAKAVTTGLCPEERRLSYYSCKIDGKTLDRPTVIRNLGCQMKIKKGIEENQQIITSVGPEALQTPEPSLIFHDYAAVDNSETQPVESLQGKDLIAFQASRFLDATHTDFDNQAWPNQSKLASARNSFFANHIGIVENLKLLNGVASTEERFRRMVNLRNSYAHNWKTPAFDGNQPSIEEIARLYKDFLADAKKDAAVYSAALRDPAIWYEPEMPSNFEEEIVPTTNEQWDDSTQVDSPNDSEVDTEETLSEDKYDGTDVKSPKPNDPEEVADWATNEHWNDCTQVDLLRNNEEGTEEAWHQENCDDTDAETLKFSGRIKRKVRLLLKATTRRSVAEPSKLSRRTERMVRKRTIRRLLKTTTRWKSLRKTSCRGRNGQRMKSHRAVFKLLKALMGKHEVVPDFDNPSMDDCEDYMATITALHQYTKPAGGTKLITIRHGEASPFKDEWGSTRTGAKSRAMASTRPRTLHAVRSDWNPGLEEESTQASDWGCGWDTVEDICDTSIADWVHV